jgi:predicted dehydrogenase
VAERGAASAGLPYSLRWRDAAGRHALWLPRRPLPRLLLERFLDALRDGRPPRPDFADACRGLAWARGARRSLAEGRRIALGGGA